MRSSFRVGVVAVAALAVGIGVAGCGSDTKSEESTKAEDTTSEVEPTPEETPPEMSIAEYIAQNGITETPVFPGDPGAPAIELPIPYQWGRLANIPQGAYDAVIVADENAGPDRPRIVTVVTKLTGNVDPAKILEYAPAEVQGLPGYEGPKTGTQTMFGEFEATSIGGAYDRDGSRRAIGQLTTVIPAPDGVYMLQMNGHAPAIPEQVQALAQASAEIAKGAKITPAG